MPGLLPSQIGRTWPIPRSSLWNSLVQTAVNNKQTGIALASFPRYQWIIPISILRNTGAYTDLQVLFGFINQCLGRVYPFFYDDPNDDTTTDEPFGTGDGVTTDFQLSRLYGGFSEPVQNPTITNIKVNGVPTAAYSLLPAGVVSFNSPPANLAALTWTGTFLWLCRFDVDTNEFSEFYSKMFEMKKLSFTSVPL